MDHGRRGTGADDGSFSFSPIWVRTGRRTLASTRAFRCYQAACPLLPADRLVLSRQDEGGDMMYRRIVTSLIAVLVVFAMAVPVAAARLSHQDLVNQRLGEVGAWAMPTAKSGEP